MRAGLTRHGREGVVPPRQNSHDDERAWPKEILLEPGKGLRDGRLEVDEPEHPGGLSEFREVCGQGLSGALILGGDAQHFG